MSNTVQPSLSLVRILLNVVIAANQNIIYQVGKADHLFLKASTGNDGDLAFSFDDQAQQGLLIGQVVTASQAGVPGGFFRTVQILNTTNASITYTIVISNGVIDFKGLVIGGVLTTQNAQNAVGNYGNDNTVGNVSTEVYIGVSNLVIILTADPGNADIIYIGFDTTVTNTKKVLALSPGMIYALNSYKGNLWAYSPTNAQKLSVSSI